MNEITTMDGEIIEAPMTASMAVQLQKGEIDQMISTAKAYPRSLQRVKQSILSMATLDEESAEECMYALPRGGKPIKGPSIRFAEILKQSYGNCRAAARVVHVDKTEGYVEAEGVFHDLETNSASTSRVRRRILDKNGRVFKDDMIIVTGNAACSIAMRNAILNGVPKPLWRRAYDTVQATIAGDVTTLAENRDKAMKAMATFGVKPERVYEALGVAGSEEITVDHIVTLRGMFSALKNGEATVEEMFAGTAKPRSDHQKVADPLSDAPAPQPQANKEDPAETAAHVVEDTPETGDQADMHGAETGEDGRDGAAEADQSDDIDPADEREPGLPDEDQEKITRYARDMLAIATGDGDPGLKKDRMAKAHTRWRGDFDKLSEAGMDAAQRVFKAIQHVATGKSPADETVQFVAAEIGCEADALAAEAA